MRPAREVELTLLSLQTSIRKNIESLEQQSGNSREDADFGGHNYDFYNSSRKTDLLLVQHDNYTDVQLPAPESGPIHRMDIPEQQEGRNLLTGHMLTSQSPQNKKVRVFTKIVFVQIGRIDTAKEKFQADVFVQARWREPSLDGLEFSMDPDDLEWTELWLPLLYIENAIGDVTEKTWRTIIYSGSEAHAVERRRVNGYFSESMELAEFPFDSQCLSAVLASERPPAEIELEEDDVDMDALSRHDFIAQEEWNLHAQVQMQQTNIIHEYTSERDRQVALKLSCVVSRKAGFFVWNIILFMMLLTLLTFVTFAVELTLPENRLLLAFYLLLATITFKLFVNGSLPKVPYLTSLDRYIIMSMTMMFCSCLWHGVVTVLNTFSSLEGSTVILLDRAAFGTFLCCFVCFQLFFFIFVANKSMKQFKRRLQRDSPKAM